MIADTAPRTGSARAGSRCPCARTRHGCPPRTASKSRRTRARGGIDRCAPRASAPGRRGHSGVCPRSGPAGRRRFPGSRLIRSGNGRPRSSTTEVICRAISAISLLDGLRDELILVRKVLVQCLLADALPRSDLLHRHRAHPFSKNQNAHPIEDLFPLLILCACTSYFSRHVTCPLYP